MKELKSSTVSVMKKFISDFLESFIVIMFLVIPFSIPIGFIEIWILNSIVGLFNPQLQVPVFEIIHDVINSFFGATLSLDAGLRELQFLVYAMFLGSATIAMYIAWDQINDSDIWWYELTEEEKEEIQNYWVSLDSHSPEQLTEG